MIYNPSALNRGEAVQKVKCHDLGEREDIRRKAVRSAGNRKTPAE